MLLIVVYIPKVNVKKIQYETNQSISIIGCKSIVQRFLEEANGESVDFEPNLHKY